MSATYPADSRDLNHLLIRSGQGDQTSFAELYRRTSAKLFGVCLRMLRDRGEAEEVLQEAYHTVWRRAGGFDASKASAITWLVTLTRNKAIDRLRQHREELLDDPSRLNDTVDEQPSPVAGAESSQAHRRLMQCMDQLEPRHRQSVREAFFSGATYNELAVRENVPLGTMKSWIRRSLLQLRACLES